MSENLYFYKGLEADLPKTNIKIGALYHCTDTKNTYRGVSATELVIFSTASGQQNENNAIVIGTGTATGEGATVIGNGTATGDYSVAYGKETIAGCMGYYIAAIDPANNHIYLSTSEISVIPTWDNPSSFYDETFESGYQIFGEDVLYGNEFSVSSDAYYHWTFAGNMTEISGNRITYSSETLNTSEKWLSNVDNSADPCVFFIPVQSDVGVTNVGTGAVAEGWNTHAAGQHSHAEGYYSIVAGRYGHAEGNSTRAGFAAHAEGLGTSALGFQSHAEGKSTTASGATSHAEGGSTKAIGVYSHAEGCKSESHGSYSHSEGYQTYAIGLFSHSEGYKTEASGSTAHAEGRGTVACGDFQHVQGKYNVKDTANNYAHIIGNGDSESKPLNIHTVDWNGNGWYAGSITAQSFNGNATSATQLKNSKAIIIDLTSPNAANFNGTSDIQPGVRGILPIKYGGTGNNTGYITTGRLASSTAGECSTAEGISTIASGKASHVEGGVWVSNNVTYYTTASGDYSHAEGQGTSASGAGAHAEGTATTASGSRSHAEGMSTQAIGNNSHAEGQSTIAKDSAAHAEGRNSKANGKYSHAEGYYTIASGQYQHVQGKYNSKDIIKDANGNPVLDDDGDEQPANTYAHIVGNGTRESARSNAHTLDWSGNAWFAGNIYVGGVDKDTGQRLPRIYSGTSEPSDNIGEIGDIYIVYEGTLKLISFTIENGYTGEIISYQAEEGMTWAQWVDSGYNTSGYILDGDNVWLESNSIAVTTDATWVEATDQIIEGHEYHGEPN